MTLHAYLKKRKESFGAFAKRAKISRATVFRIKKGDSAGFTGNTIAKVIDACDGRVSANELLGIKSKPKSA